MKYKLNDFKYSNNKKRARLLITVNHLFFELQVSWIRQRDWHILSSGNIGTFTKDQRFQLLHVPNSHEWTLMIKYLNTRDEGTYVCQVNINEL